MMALKVLCLSPREFYPLLSMKMAPVKRSTRPEKVSMNTKMIQKLFFCLEITYTLKQSKIMDGR